MNYFYLGLLEYDKNLSYFIYNYFDNIGVTNFFAFITDFTLASAAVILLIIFYMTYKKLFREGIFFILSICLILIVDWMIKLITSRPRPFAVNDSISYLGTNAPAGYSFPSLHATMAFFVSYFLCLQFNLSFNKKSFLYALAFMIAFSRIYLGAHYISDVLVGAIIGILFGRGAFLIKSKLSFKTIIKEIKKQ